jgi:acetylornithine deacetylase
MLAMSAHFEGPGGHSSLSDLTAAPLLQAARLAAAIGDYGDQYRSFGNDPYKGLCTNIGALKSDGAYNVIPTEADLLFSMRPPPGDDVSARESALYALAKQSTPGAKMKTIVALSPFASREPSAFASIFEKNFVPIDLPYWTEAAMLSEAGVNAIVYGPGDVGQAHKPNEYVTGAHLLAAHNVYTRAISGAWHG